MGVIVLGGNGQLGKDCLSVVPEADGLDLPELDITQRFQTLEKLDELAPEVLINCAAVLPSL